MVKGPRYSLECEFHAKYAFTLGGKCEGHAMHSWWAFTPPVWCEFGGFHAIIFTVCLYAVGWRNFYLCTCMGGKGVYSASSNGEN